MKNLIRIDLDDCRDSPRLVGVEIEASPSSFYTKTLPRLVDQNGLQRTA